MSDVKKMNSEQLTEMIVNMKQEEIIHAEERKKMEQ